MKTCPDCSREHLGPPCGGLSFRERLLSVRLGPSVTPTRTRRNYFDSDALDATFGPDRVESYWEETRGHGAVHRGPDGELYHRDRSGQVKVATDQVLADITAGQESRDVV